MTWRLTRGCSLGRVGKPPSSSQRYAGHEKRDIRNSSNLRQRKHRHWMGVCRTMPQYSGCIRDPVSWGAMGVGGEVGRRPLLLYTQAALGSVPGERSIGAGTGSTELAVKHMSANDDETNRGKVIVISASNKMVRINSFLWETVYPPGKLSRFQNCPCFQPGSLCQIQVVLQTSFCCSSR